ncbi:MAG: peptidyl-prolyl cis-trans isomerase [Campylobacterota bacterium]|nr:peptidyl-prolyl cis-trans isomerase [Campylobacterota bacterium]
MKKYILILLCCCTFAYAGLVNGIAIIVNDTPITLYDIDKMAQSKKVSKQKAADILIDEKIYEQELKNKNISVDIFDVDNYIEKLAASNKMNTLDFKALVRQQQNYELFKENIKKQLLHQKLIRKVAAGKLKTASPKDIQIFYNNNKEQYKIANTIDVVAYVSKNKKLLNQLKSNPMLQDKSIMIQNITLKQNELTPQSKYILNSTKVKQFSAIFAQNKNYNMFFIKEKKDIKRLTLDEVKDNIFQNIMKKREQNYLKEYFETLKITADIKVIR